MKPPVEHVRISSKGREVLVKMKRYSGLEHWNEVARIALLRSLANPTRPPVTIKHEDTSIDIDWKVFSGQYDKELSVIFWLRAHKDGVDLLKKDAISDYFRAHLERGIDSLNLCKSLYDLVQYD